MSDTCTPHVVSSCSLSNTMESGSSGADSTTSPTAPRGWLGDLNVNEKNDPRLKKAQQSLTKALWACQAIHQAVGGGLKTTHLEVAALLYYATHPEATQTEIGEAVGVSQQAISRMVIGKWSTVRGGAGLLTIERDAEDMRKMLLSWTPKGRALITRVHEIIE
jgi:DNA-binding MarR family transcriptional regulator